MDLRRLLFIPMFFTASIGGVGAAHDGELQLLLQSRSGEGNRIEQVPETWDATATAVIVCDMWDAHHCLNAVKRGAELAPEIDKFVARIRDAGGTVIHAPSSCMEFYKDHPARKRAQSVALSKELPVGIESWLDWIDEKEKAAGYPIDHSDGGEDDDPVEHEAWAKELESKGKNPRAPWMRQAEGIRIDDEKDFITDDGKQNWSILESREITNVILLGVHTNMCVLGRPFGLRQMAKNGKNVVLVRDLTDTMYNPAMRPKVSHFQGTDLIIEHVETFVCPTISSEQVLGGMPHRFEADKRKHLVMMIGEKEYSTIDTLPKFAKAHLSGEFRISYVLPDPQAPNIFLGIDALSSADVLLVSVRRRALPEEQLEILKKYVTSGKPVVGIRTASHAFSLRGKPAPDGHAVWEKWDQEVFGGNYHGHLGNEFGTFAGASGKHPILSGLKREEFTTGGSLYEVSPLEDGAEVLMVGRADTIAPPEPVAWTFERKDGGRSFYTSLGHVDDFNSAPFVGLIKNGIHWAAGIEASKKKLKASAAAAETKFQLADDLAIDLVLAEPIVQQPLHLSFDRRGRLWVVQYIQYPDPAGIREVSRDKVWRTVYDKVPPPPPHAPDSPFRGKDKITIHEDTDGDGEFDKHKVFVDGLNLATSIAHDRDGIWVTNPPYLLFYPDKDRDDVPDGPPVVHLKGFGLEDTHSVASSLCWGPDGWLYGAQGSTVSGAVMRPGIDKTDADAVKSMGQNVWRYHPERKIYEVFAEGGGNTFGVEIDSKGRVFSGHNGGDTRGFHYVQGGYYQKTFGKHGELTNPYSFGYFPAMKNAKVARFVHQFIIYEGYGGMPSRFRGKLLGVDVMHNNLVLSDLTPLGSTFETRDIERPVATRDKNFRPVHIAEAPDGSVFIADWYDQQVNHYKNHEGQIDHEKGRIYRVRSKDHEPDFEVETESHPAVVLELWRSRSRWRRQHAQQLLLEEEDPALIEDLHLRLAKSDGQFALEVLWGLARRDGLDRKTGLAALRHRDPHVRLWAIRLLEDHGLFEGVVADRVEAMANSETNVEVLSQIACTAKRAGAKEGLAIAANLAKRDEIADDPHLPLLVWWAIEARCEKHPQAVADLVAGTTAMGLDRLAMKRFAMSGRQADFDRCARLLREAPDAQGRRLLMESLEEGLAGRPLGAFPRSLEIELEKSRSWAQLVIRLGQGNLKAIPDAIRFLGLEAVSLAGKKSLLIALAKHKDERIVPTLLEIGTGKGAPELSVAAIAALAASDDPSIPEHLLDRFAELPSAAKSAALDTLTSRLVWARVLVTRVETKDVARAEVSGAHVEKLRRLDPELAKLWPAPSRAKTGETIARLKKVISVDGGVPKKGEVIFSQRCSACHLMFNKGGKVGPDLTSYQKNDLDTLLLSVVDPSAEIREGFEQAIVKLKDGAVHNGFVTEKDDELVSLRELSGTQRSISIEQIAEMETIGISLMPPGLLGGLDDAQIRDLFAYLRSTTPPY